jgi:hypothetical protein
MKTRPTDAEFEELKRKRDESIAAWVAALCKEHGWDPNVVQTHVSHNSACYCACPDGPCQHIWNGPEYTEESEGGGFMSSVTCARCGTPAIYHDMRCGP